MTKMSSKWILAAVLRLLGIGATLAAAIFMATSNEEVNLFSLVYEAKYSDIPAFVYFVIASAVVAVYSILVAFVPSGSRFLKFVVAGDVVATMLLTSSISAAVAVAQVGKNGNSHAGWLPICGRVRSFCDHVTYALIAGFAAVILYMVVLFSSFRFVLEDDDDDDDDCC